MKILQEIKDEVAVECGFDDFKSYWNSLYPHILECIGVELHEFMDEVAKRYAEQAIDKCAEVAEAEDMSDSPPIVNKESILKVKNLLT